jgi:phosphate-selective porin OprO/OprP
MKKYILMPVLALMAFTAVAQDFDNDPALQLENKQKEVKFTVGARMMADAALYHTDFTPMKSGATISDARIRTSMTYKNWYFYADFGFGGGKFSQKNIFLQYSKDAHTVKLGYYNDPAGTMARNTSLGSYHFISRPGSTNSLGVGRELGVSYKYNTDRFMAYQGVFTENQYNKIKAGFNGVTIAGCYLYRPLVSATSNAHIGVNARFAHLGGGEVYKNVLKKSLHLGQSLETFVDEDEQFVSADLDWANNVLNLGAEVLYHNEKFFARGEFIYKYVTKKRDSYSLFIDAQDNIDGWGDIDWWENANRLKNNKFFGGYVEMGFQILGGGYKYNSKEGVLCGLDGKALEVVARYNYTGMNNRTDGEYFNRGRGHYYANGYMEDWPGTGATSVGGGDIHSVTLGLNYAFNRYVLCMVDYTWHKLDKPFLPNDKNFHVAQARVQFTF